MKRGTWGEKIEPWVYLCCFANSNCLNLVPDFVTFFLKNFVFLASLIFHQMIYFFPSPSALGLFLAGRQGCTPGLGPAPVLVPELPAHGHSRIRGAHNCQHRADSLPVFLMMSALWPWWVNCSVQDQKARKWQNRDLKLLTSNWVIFLPHVASFRDSYIESSVISLYDVN